MRVWDKFLTEQDKAVFAQSGHGKRGGFGTRPALLVVDMQNYFVAEGMPSYVPEAKTIVPNINRLARAVRAQGGFLDHRARRDQRRAVHPRHDRAVLGLPRPPSPREDQGAFWAQ
mgnify:CR=1 FL=1